MRAVGREWGTRPELIKEGQRGNRRGELVQRKIMKEEAAGEIKPMNNTEAGCAERTNPGWLPGTAIATAKLRPSRSHGESSNVTA